MILAMFVVAIMGVTIPYQAAVNIKLSKECKEFCAPIEYEVDEVEGKCRCFNGRSAQYQ